MLMDLGRFFVHRRGNDAIDRRVGPCETMDRQEDCMVAFDQGQPCTGPKTDKKLSVWTQSLAEINVNEKRQASTDWVAGALQ